MVTSGRSHTHLRRLVGWQGVNGAAVHSFLSRVHWVWSGVVERGRLRETVLWPNCALGVGVRPHQILASIVRVWEWSRVVGGPRGLTPRLHRLWLVALSNGQNNLHHSLHVALQQVCSGQRGKWLQCSCSTTSAGVLVENDSIPPQELQGPLCVQPPALC